MANREIVKRVKNAVFYSDGCIRIDDVRGSYVHVDKPFKKKGAPDDQVAKFSVVGLASKDTHGEAKEAIEEFIRKLLKDNKDAKVGKKDWFIRDGDDSGKEEAEGMWTINASEQKRPKCRDRSGELVEIEDVPEMFKSGYRYNILIRPWFQDNVHGKKVNSGLVGIQFREKAPVFGNSEIDDSDAWDTVEGNDEDDGL